ncbi:sugar ABC transporter permease [Vallitalea guaymasensis]|uniref:Sugar ABC transporter permease n=2 Tax=Vallitalea guaymasensis TaxID=1185412 RepID=A0A8J8MFN0_9FIRM|nr:ABC transporter permease subunit [Vallitalea guaymasensis]QUH31969.1 sugar ABC transporter permease [Vallitalea guaymasensis]
MKQNWPLYIMLIPAGILLLIFSYYPMYGVSIAFQDYQPVNGFFGSPFVGLKWFKYVFEMPDFKEILSNTLIMAIGKILIGTLFSIVFALLLNEIKNRRYKKTVQTIVYLPYFLSWVIIGGIFVDLLSADGLINQVINLFGHESIMFLGDNRYFRGTMILTDVWKSFGYGAIIYLAAMTGIDPQLYESARMDGANRLKQALHITLPGILPTIILLATLSIGNILNAGFDQILIMYNEVVYETGDIIDTFVYRVGLESAQFSLSTAVGLFKSVVSFIMIGISYTLAYKFADYRIF